MSRDSNSSDSNDTADWTPQRLSRVIPELRKRWIVRAMTSYALALWLIIQACDITFQVLGLPEGAMQGLVGVGLCGMPVAVATGWIIGLRQSCGVARADARKVDEPHSRLGAYLIALIIGSACLLVLLSVVQVV